MPAFDAAHAAVSSAIRSARSSGASPVRITTMRSSDSRSSAGSAHATAWPVPLGSGWSAISTSPSP